MPYLVTSSSIRTDKESSRYLADYVVGMRSKPSHHLGVAAP